MITRTLRQVSAVPRRVAPSLPRAVAPVAPVRALSLSAQQKHDYRPSLLVKWDPKWITEESERIMAKGYDRHNSLGDRSDRERPIPTKEELESPLLHAHYPAQTIGDKFAYNFVELLKPFTHAFFRDKYNHHAVVLETVAAVPGMVGGAFRHLRSLRRMQRDNGWIHPLWEEAENERMHLLIWMQVTKPTALEKALVVLAQSVYGAAYTLMYLLRPQIAHRFVGYLEEEAVAAYTAYLGAIDSGAIKNGPAPDIAKKYYRLPDTATIRDVILYVRIDECMHRCLNHKFGDLSKLGLSDQPPNYPDVSATEATPDANVIPSKKA